MQYNAVNPTTTYSKFGYDVADYTFGRNPCGLEFIASQSLTSSITSSCATIYRLYPTKFPHGEIAEGPAPMSDHNDQTPIFSCS